MQLLLNRLINFYRCLMCAWIIGCRCLLINVRSRFKTVNQAWVNQLARRGAHTLFRFIRTQYKVTYTHAIPAVSEGPYIFMSNHQSHLDLPLIYASMMGTIRLIAKKDLFAIPLFGKTLTLSQCIPVDREHPAEEIDLFNKVKQKMASGITYWIFPEGTRSLTGNLLPFKVGGFRLARELGAKIIPVGIIGTKEVLPAKKLTITMHQSIHIRIGAPIDTRDYPTLESQHLLVDKVRHSIEQLIRAPLHELH